MNYELRYAAHPEDFKSYDTNRIRQDFLIENVMVPGEINVVYTLYDRLIVGGAVPTDKPLKMEPFNELKADYFLQRRELGIINIGGDAKVTADGNVYELGYKEALYLGSGNRDVTFESVDPEKPAHLYLNSATAHKQHPNKKITLDMAVVEDLGSKESANERRINRLIVNDVTPTCQVQMGITELKTGSVWNTMPPHLHTRRMEAYLYFEVSENEAICHFMGQPGETRHIWMKNQQAVISPSWSIHSAAGTSNYSFIWGMAGENQDFGDMDHYNKQELR
ncbi:MAG: 4-deoxy-L-threo-5-hexosulose-uronate ketol-isomerase [Anaerophaga sp.]|uniref:5-dehydro-4-deoxy-D-glucuronate isomerase n=1 Tax=Anaerophaga thermohalophila TaxID=177400 RepID=UPI000237CA1B|nr:5-dehydro-4-deoxy-D-glucuronate isomerase [Anaerophaga thermohalophila]MDI3520650.1 4-deoxy-L-threo-5-hexosulose-uronate ketol-isomerase [Anaerophaga sp.]MDK2842486.1 4-deoxy-L-threo-5-hexosulose-uronate ketol-isomerase [Anaerophaga sp.]